MLALVLALLMGGAAGGGSTDGTVYGEGVGDGDILPISDLLANPDPYLDEVVRVEGVVSDVCTRMGCWIEISAMKNREASIRLKVEDGVIVFPKEVKGKWARAQGTLRKLELSEERAIARAEHFAEEKGEKFDPESIQGPQVIYQLDGIGALIYPVKKAPKS
jgi:hypothetical protein